MSRSYRKPYYTDQQHSPYTKLLKRKAARAVRHAGEVADGKQYRKHFDSWNIRDWAFYSKDPKARRK